MTASSINRAGALERRTSRPSRNALVGLSAALALIVCGFSASAQESDEGPLRLLPREVEAPQAPVADAPFDATDFEPDDTVGSLIEPKIEIGL